MMIRANTIRTTILAGGALVLSLAAVTQISGAQAQDGRPFFGFPPFPGPGNQSLFGGSRPQTQAPTRQRGAQRDAVSRGQYASSVARHAAANGVPPELVHRVIMRESRYNPRAVSKGNYGMMQIRLGTARAMGYTGSAAGLLDADTNMTYAVRYLAGALRAAGGNHDRAVSNYARGYYHEAKRKGFSPYGGFSPYTTAAAQQGTMQLASLLAPSETARSAYASTGRGIAASGGDGRDAAINVMTAKESSP